jgi:hypothetical protein
MGFFLSLFGGKAVKAGGTKKATADTDTWSGLAVAFFELFA